MLSICDRRQHDCIDTRFPTLISSALTISGLRHYLDLKRMFRHCFTSYLVLGESHRRLENVCSSLISRSICFRDNVTVPELDVPSGSSGHNRLAAGLGGRPNSDRFSCGIRSDATTNPRSSKCRPCRVITHSPTIRKIHSRAKSDRSDLHDSSRRK